MTCEICKGLGFVSRKNSEMAPESNVFGLYRRVHPNGEVTWEGECQVCRGTGTIAQKRLDKSIRVPD